MRSVCNHHSKILQHHRIITDRTRTHTHTTHAIRLSSLQDFTTSPHHHPIARAHTHIRRIRSVCNHHSKILQHHRIITAIERARTHTYDVCDPFVIITPRFNNIIASSPDRTRAHTHTYDACDPFVIITPRFYNIIASSPDRTATRAVP